MVSSEPSYFRGLKMYQILMLDIVWSTNQMMIMSSPLIGGQTTRYDANFSHRRHRLGHVTILD